MAKEVHFFGIDVMVEAPTAKEAYTLLCEALGSLELREGGLKVDWNTGDQREYLVYDEQGNEVEGGEIAELWPD